MRGDLIAATGPGCLARTEEDARRPDRCDVELFGFAFRLRASTATTQRQSSVDVDLCKLHVIERIFDEMIHRDPLRDPTIARVLQFNPDASTELDWIELTGMAALGAPVWQAVLAQVLGYFTIKLRGRLLFRRVFVRGYFLVDILTCAKCNNRIRGGRLARNEDVATWIPDPPRTARLIEQEVLFLDALVAVMAQRFAGLAESA
jgi:hypothetical protein